MFQQTVIRSFYASKLMVFFSVVNTNLAWSGDQDAMGFVNSEDYSSEHIVLSEGSFTDKSTVFMIYAA